MKINACNVIIKDLAESDCSIISFISEIQKKNIAKEKSHYFLYQESNLKEDYNQDLSNKRDKVFYAESAENGEILGFAHFKLQNDTITLSHILLSNPVIDCNLVEALFLSSLKSIKSNHSSFSSLKVDVFEKDKKLFNFYLKLGMEISGYSYWYDITNYCTRPALEANFKSSFFGKSAFRVVREHNNCKLLYHEEKLVGTLVKENNLIIRSEIDSLLFRKINLFFKNSSLESVSLVSKRELELFLIDKSFHLTMSLKKLEAIIQHVSA